MTKSRTSTKHMNVARVLSGLRIAIENAEIEFKKTSIHCGYRDEYCDMYMCLKDPMVGECGQKKCPYMKGEIT